jgi:hypothetical protein
LSKTKKEKKMHKTALILITLVALIPTCFAATYASIGLPESKAIIFGYPGSGSTYYAPYVDSNGLQRIDSVASVTNIPSLDICDTVTVVDTVNTVTTVTTVTDVTDVTNVTSVDTVDAVTEVANVTSVDDVDEVANVTSVDTVDAVTEVANVTSVDTVDAVTEVANVTSVDTVDAVTTVTTVSTVTSVSNIAAGTIDINYLTESFLTEVERGNISGVSLISINTMHDALSSAQELINPADSPEVNLAAAATLYVSSSSATDDKDSTGAKTIKLIGIDASGNDTQETINLEGQTTEETTILFSKLFSAQVMTEGASGQVGDIYVHKDASVSSGVPAVGSQIFLKIPIGYGSCSAGKYQVPAGDTAVLVDMVVGCSGTGPYSLFVRNKKSGAASNVVGPFMLKDGINQIKLNMPLAAGEYVWFTALSGNAGDDISLRARILKY